MSDSKFTYDSVITQIKDSVQFNFYVTTSQSTNCRPVLGTLCLQREGGMQRSREGKEREYVCMVQWNITTKTPLNLEHLYKKDTFVVPNAIFITNSIL